MCIAKTNTNIKIKNWVIELALETATLQTQDFPKKRAKKTRDKDAIQ